MVDRDTILPTQKPELQPNSLQLDGYLINIPGAVEIVADPDNPGVMQGFHLGAVSSVESDGVTQDLSGYLRTSESVYSIARVSDKNPDKPTTIVLNRLSPNANGATHAEPSGVILLNKDVTIDGEVVVGLRRDNEFVAHAAKLDTSATLVSSEALSNVMPNHNEAIGATREKKLSLAGLKKVVAKRQKPNGEVIPEPTLGSEALLDPRVWSAETGSVLSFLHDFKDKQVEGISVHVSESTAESGEVTISELTQGMAEQDAKVIQQVIRKGKYLGAVIDPPEVLVRSGSSAMLGRRKFAGIAAKDPEVAKELADRQIAGYHGTRSAALAGVLREGYIGSGRHLREQEAFTFTGEHMFQDAEGQGNISFSTLDSIDSVVRAYSGSKTNVRNIDDLQASLDTVNRWVKNGIDDDGSKFGPDFLGMLGAVAKDQQRSLDYIKTHPDSIEAQLTLDSFPVIFGIGADLIDRQFDDPANSGKQWWEVITPGTSEFSEFRINLPKIDKADVSLIIVPKEKVAMVRELCQQYGFANTVVAELETFYTEEE